MGKLTKEDDTFVRFTVCIENLSGIEKAWINVLYEFAKEQSNVIFCNFVAN